MRFKRSTYVLIGLTALSQVSCSVSRKASQRRWELRTEVRTDTVREEVLVMVRDTVWEKTTETVQVNASGDTLRRSIVTDRLTVRDRSRDSKLRVKREASQVDSISVEEEDKAVAAGDMEMDKEGNLTTKKADFWSKFNGTLRWVFGILCAFTALLITHKVSTRKGL